MKRDDIKISDYDYDLPEARIAKFPLAQRDRSKLLLYRAGHPEAHCFHDLDQYLPEGSLLVFNNTKVIRARLVFYKESGARIEIFCLEPAEPADYERAFAVEHSCTWHCIVGNLKKWKEGALTIRFEEEGQPYTLTAERLTQEGKELLIRFRWDAPKSFGQLLETLGRIPIPPYLRRESEEVDNTRYQTVYSKFEGSVAAPTAGLHFTPEILERLRQAGHPMEEVTLHVGAGTFLPVKSDRVTEHAMHTEHFEIHADTLRNLIRYAGRVTAVGTTSVRTLESLTALGYRTLQHGDPDADRPVGQWEIYDLPDTLSGVETLEALATWMAQNGRSTLKTATRIMIMPGYRFRVVNALITNFHQPKSTLLLLVSALIGESWREVYRFALEHDFRFLSYGDSSLLIPDK
ncbi:MAG: S-adenosylmethionine:tRNA ribosyltransferase-isomerase [Alistipes sp.]|nr:S-adenosylmethionine:tRNA ribosyltransferase-isomerase [Alistipes sp.]